VFDAADWRSPEEPEEGGRVYQVEAQADGRIALRFGNGAVNFSRIRPGDLIWRTHDPDLDKLARQFTDPGAPVTRQPVRVRVTASEGAPLVTEWNLANRPDVSVIVISDAELGHAQSRGLSEAYLREQFGRLGNTPYELAQVELDVTGTPYAPSSVLNQVRREAVEKLQALQGELRPVVVHKPAVESKPATQSVQPGAPQLHLLVRTAAQLEAALTLNPASITLDYLDLYGMKPSVDRVKSAGIEARAASPRISKPGEQRILDFLLSLDCAILLRSAGMLEALRDKPHPPLTGDFSLNTANSLTADTFLEMGLSRLTPTHDLNAAQVADLARRTSPASIEVIAYHHLPVFHTEHCVFCRFLSNGTSYKDCGRPCESHRVALRDPAGRAHPVMADVGCRNTVFGAEAQEASNHLEAWRGAGLSHFRLEFVHESADQVRRVTRAFESALAGQTSYAQLAQELARIAPEGTTQGSLFVPSDYLTLPILQ
jgi:U32 family peptidase